MDGRTRGTGSNTLVNLTKIIFITLRKVYNIIMIHEGEAHFVNSVEMSSNSGEHILEILKEQKEMLELRGMVVVAVVGDNASGVQNALAR